MKRNVLLSLIGLFGLFSISTSAQALRATSFELKEADRYFGGKLYITVNGEEKKIAEKANDIWLINNGKEVVYSGRDGAGGYEGEGQSLRIYEVQTGKTRKIMSQYYEIFGLSAFKLKNGRTAILVRMEDSGLGASYFSVVDPKRGEVFFRISAELAELKGDRIKLLFYDDWSKIVDARDVSYYQNKNAFPTTKAKAKPIRTEFYDLKKLLKKKVIYNKPTIEILDGK